MQPARLRLGQLLVDAQILSGAELERMLSLQRSDGRRLGTLLVESGLVTETQLTQILSQQLSVPWVSLYHIDFSRELLNLVPRELAEKYCLVPIYVRPVRSQGDTLYLAMEDPMNEEALRACSESSKLPARAMIAAPSDIAKALRLYYGSALTSPASPRLAGAPSAGAIGTASAVATTTATTAIPRADALQGAAGKPHLEVVDDEAEPWSLAPSVSAEEPPGGSVAIKAPLSTPDDDAPTLEVREIELPRGPRRSAGLELTLLDGTQIRLPSAQKRGAPAASTAPSDGDLTAGELLAALRAAAHGADDVQIQGENLRWEKMFAAILSLLLRKHLIMGKELIDELKKM